MKPFLRIILENDSIDFYIADNTHLFQICELLDKLDLNWEFV